MNQRKKEVAYLMDKYKRLTGKSEIDMNELAKFAIENGWPAPEQITPEQRLAKSLAKAAREVTRTDKFTGHPYRAYHAVKDDFQGTFWVDIDEAPRRHMEKSTYARREQIIGEMIQLTFDQLHWNNIHPNEEPLVLETDLTPDVEERLALEGIITTS